MKRVGLAALPLLLALPLWGCNLEVPYKQVSETVTIDPTTRHMIRVTKWQYADGVTQTTTDDLNAVGNDDRRTQPRQRTEFFDPF